MADASHPAPTLDDRLLAGLTVDHVAKHLRARGWRECPEDGGKPFVGDDGARYARFVRPLPRGTVAAAGSAPYDQTAVPLDGDAAARAGVLAASAHRDGLDLAKVAAELGL